MNSNDLVRVLPSSIIAVGLVIAVAIVSNTARSYSKDIVGIEEKKMLIDAIDNCRTFTASYSGPGTQFSKQEYASCLRDKGYYDIAEQYSGKSEVNQDDASSESEETVK